MKPDGQPLRSQTVATLSPSGANWVYQFPGSSALADLKTPFREAAEAFVNALHAAGASVSVSATYRPPERAYLMHWCWMIVKRNVDPATVPAMEGVDIKWAHNGADGKYSRKASVAAAKAMVNAFGISRLGVAPALQSRHTLGFAIDMSIRWAGTLKIADANGKIVEIGTAPRSGLNAQLHRVGASYGVIKYNRSGRDDPHWSDNGT